ncbi:uncharacterized protein LOC132276554 [Cornus florida]|uniref:uncharacterized protein LOC132276554 n=1 Tax=Cornus florida TaxID=4283 RepID=UPI00289E291E|nr:uncharacterized protein LOC132276554 [Cornus florida]
MYYTTQYFSLSLLFLAINVTLFFSGYVQAVKPLPTGTNPFCNTADFKPLCNRMVRGAKTLDEATANAIKSTLEVVKGAKPKLRILEPAVAKLKRPVTKKAMKGTCQESFNNVVSNLEGALKDLKSGDKYSVNDRLSAATLDDCNDAFAESGKKSPLAGFGGDLRMYVSNCLAVTQQK